MRVVFVHGACVTDGAWWWRPTADLLAQRGVPSVSPLLPSCGETGIEPTAAGPGLSDDVAAVRSVLADGDEPTILVAHSYGGIVAADAAAGISSVRGILLISSYLPLVGESLADFGDGGPAPFLTIAAQAGNFGVRSDLLTETFLQDCAGDVQEQAAARLASQSLRVLAEPVGAAAWESIPTTYLVCADDRGTPPRLQRAFARRADAVIELASGHHPFLSQPAAVRDIVLSL